MSSSSGSDPGPPTTDTGRWVEELLLGVDVGNDVEVIHRWRTAPVIGVTGSATLGSPGDALDGAVQQLNAALAGSDVELTVDASSSQPDIRVIIGTPAELEAAKEEVGLSGFTGSSWVWWDSNSWLIEALVFVETGFESELVLTEGLARSLGVLKTSDIFADSVFASGYTTYSARDATLLEFLYTQLAAGESRIVLRIAFNAWWPNPE